jgi:hypothetical protein
VEVSKMFKTCNLSVAEKSLILGFIAGQTGKIGCVECVNCFIVFFAGAENPCPDRGDIFNIRLNQTEESIKQSDGLYKPMIVDTYFQMNFKTKDYKQIKKYRDKEME